MRSSSEEPARARQKAGRTPQVLTLLPCTPYHVFGESVAYLTRKGLPGKTRTAAERSTTNSSCPDESLFKPKVDTREGD